MGKPPGIMIYKMLNLMVLIPVINRTETLGNLAVIKVASATDRDGAFMM